MNIFRISATRLFLPCVLLISQATHANAQEKSSIRVLDAKTTERTRRVQGATSGLSAILSGEYGIMKATPAKKESFNLKRGDALELKLLAGWLMQDFMIDSGLGFYYYKVRGIERSVVDSVEVEGDQEISVSGLLLEFSPSYRLTDNLFAGLVTQVRTPGFNDYYSKAGSIGALVQVGGQIGWQFFDRELNSRITFKTMTSLGLKGWSDIAYLGGLHFGLPFRQPDALVIRKTTVVNKLKDVIEYRKKDFTINITSNVIKLALDNILTFYVDPSGRPILTAEAQSFLVDLGASLQNNDGLWEILRIDAQTPGHITSVHDSMISIGVNPRKIRKGKSIQKVADGGDASVDFTFSGVKNPNQLAEKIRSAMRAAKVPENCGTDGTCE